MAQTLAAPSRGSGAGASVVGAEAEKAGFGVLEPAGSGPGAQGLVLGFQQRELMQQGLLLHSPVVPYLLLQADDARLQLVTATPCF